MANRTKATAEKKAAFCDALASTGNVTRAAGQTGIGRAHWYSLRADDAAFAAAWDEALERGTDALEDEAVRRASEGVLKPVFYQGQECGHVREYSDTLLIFMLKARRPEKFKERAEQQLTGKDGERLVPVLNVTLSRDPA